MAVTLEPNEIEEFLRDGHTLILSSVDKDGFPHSIPLWYAYIDGKIMFRKLANSQGVVNIRRNDKVSALVETGDKWVDLKAVMIRGRAVEVTDAATIERFKEENARKYLAFRSDQKVVPNRVKQHYSQPPVFLQVVPEKKIVSWWNRKIRMKS